MVPSLIQSENSLSKLPSVFSDTPWDFKDINPPPLRKYLYRLKTMHNWGIMGDYVGSPKITCAHFSTLKGPTCVLCTPGHAWADYWHQDMV